VAAGRPVLDGVDDQRVGPSSLQVQVAVNHQHSANRTAPVRLQRVLAGLCAGAHVVKSKAVHAAITAGVLVSEQWCQCPGCSSQSAAGT
jgi:hypothetical protein